MRCEVKQVKYEGRQIPKFSNTSSNNSSYRILTRFTPHRIADWLHKSRHYIWRILLIGVSDMSKWPLKYPADKAFAILSVEHHGCGFTSACFKNPLVTRTHDGQLIKSQTLCLQGTSRVILTYHSPLSVESSKCSADFTVEHQNLRSRRIAYAKSRTFPLFPRVLDVRLCVLYTPCIAVLRFYLLMRWWFGGVSVYQRY